MIEYSTRPVTPHTLVALMENKPGVLNRVASLFRQRGFNIESLTVTHTERPDLSRMTIVIDANTTNVEQVIKQLYKLIEITEVTEITADPHISRELALIKISTANGTRSEVLQLVDVYKAVVVDIGAEAVTAEVTGPSEKIDSMVAVMTPYGIKEMVRTGVIAMVRDAAS